LSWYNNEALYIFDACPTKKAHATIPGSIAVRNNRMLVATTDYCLEPKIVFYGRHGPLSADQVMTPFGVTTGDVLGDIRQI
jgi:hypothetical protein